MVIDRRPISGNKGPNAHYTEALREAALSRRPLILVGPLYARMLWFHKDPTGQDALVATKPGAPTVVYEFKLPINLHKNSAQIRKLRRMAAEKGFEFKLIVVTPPKRIEVFVEGLSETLHKAFLERLDSTALASIAGHVEIEDVSDVEITSLNVHGEDTDVAGQGVIDVRLDYGGGEERDGVTSFDSFPFEFDMTLNAHHQVVEMRRLEVGTSSFYS